MRRLRVIRAPRWFMVRYAHAFDIPVRWWWPTFYLRRRVEASLRERILNRGGGLD